MKEITDSMIKNIGLYIVRTVQKKSILSGFQYIVGFDELEDFFKIDIANDNELISDIVEELGNREEVADVEIDDGFDVVLYTDYAPNYNAGDYDEDWE